MYDTLKHARNDANYLSHFKYNDFALVLIYAGNYINLLTFIDGKPETQTSGFKPSPLHSWDGEKALADAVGFMLLRSCDVDPKYFECQGFTEKHMEYNEESSVAEEIRLMLFDFEDGNKKQFSKYCHN